MEVHRALWCGGEQLSVGPGVCRVPQGAGSRPHLAPSRKESAAAQAGARHAVPTSPPRSDTEGLTGLHVSVMATLKRVPSPPAAPGTCAPGGRLPSVQVSGPVGTWKRTVPPSSRAESSAPSVAGGEHSSAGTDCGLMGGDRGQAVSSPDSCSQLRGSV